MIDDLDKSFNPEQLEKNRVAQVLLKKQTHTSELDYSEGESDCEFEIPYRELKEKAQIARLYYHWRQVIKKSRAAATLLFKIRQLHMNVIKHGTTTNLYANRGSRANGPEGSCQVCMQKLVILPDSKFKIFWNIVITILLIYTAIFVPYNVAFVEGDEASTANDVLSTTMDILFTIDIFVNFISGYEDDQEGKVVTDMRRIAKTYLSGWFLPDVLACIPFQLIINSEGDSSAASSAKLIRLSRLPRLYRLVRVVRMLKMMKVFKSSQFFASIFESLNNNIVGTRLLKLVFLTFYLVHLMACFWYGYANFIGYPYNSWVMANEVRQSSPIVVVGDPGPYKYMVAVYWAFQAVTTVGYGDHYWGDGMQHEYIIAIVWMFVGSFIYTLSIGNVSSMIAASDSKAAVLSH